MKDNSDILWLRVSETHKYGRVLERARDQEGLDGHCGLGNKSRQPVDLLSADEEVACG